MRNGKIDIDEFRRRVLVGLDAADLCRSEENVLRTLRLEILKHCTLVGQIQFSMAGAEQIIIATGAQPTFDRGTNQSGMPGHQNRYILIHYLASLFLCKKFFGIPSRTLRGHTLCHYGTNRHLWRY